MGLGLGIAPRVRSLVERVVRPPRRAWQTRLYRTKKVALGEPLYSYSNFPRDWIFLDWKEADHVIDLTKDTNLPFEDNSKSIIYSAHLIEHLPQPILIELLKQCFRVLEPGGRIRFECPDAEKLADLYRKSDPHMLEHFRKFRRETVVEPHGFDKKYLEDHLSLLGEMSNYIIPGHNFHMPVYAPREEFEAAFQSLDLDKFGEWCISLQTPEQRTSGGHQNILYFSKLKRLLEEAGFRDVISADYDQTTIPELKLNENSQYGVQVKAYRRFYSLYVEATKPAVA